MMRGIGSGWQERHREREQESWVQIGLGLCGVFALVAVLMIVVALIAGCGTCRTQCQDTACMSQCNVVRW